jgi:hypothetical protein
VEDRRRRRLEQGGAGHRRPRVAGAGGSDWRWRRGVDGEEEDGGAVFSLEEEETCTRKKKINGPAHPARTGVRRLVGDDHVVV